MREIDNFYLKLEEPNQGCLLALKRIILDADIEISESLKYGAPCFSYKNAIFCYLWIEKKSNTPYILFVEGRYMDHPELDAGDRKRMKIFKVDPEKDLPISTIEILLGKALELYKSGKIKTKG